MSDTAGDMSAVAGAAPAAARQGQAWVAAVVAAYARRIARRMLGAWLLGVAALGGAVPLLAVAWDHAWPGGLPRGLLRGWLVVWGLLVAGGVAAALLATLARRISPVFAARQLERVRSIRHSSLVNAVLLRRCPAGRYAAEAAARQAARELAGHPPQAGAEPRPWRLPAGLGGAVLAAWVAYIALAPKPTWPSLARLLGAERPAPTATWLVLRHPGPDDVLHVGDPVELVVEARGREVEAARLDLLDSDGRPVPGRARVVRIARETAGGPALARFSLAPLEVQGDIRFRCAAGDGRLEGRIPVQPQPEITALAIELRPPAYTREPATTVRDPDLDVLAGTIATFNLRANVELRDPVFVFQAARESRTRMAVLPEAPQTATLALALLESGTYRVEFSDLWGYRGRGSGPHRIRVRPDRPPAVEIVSPPAEQTPGNVLDVRRAAELVAEASDDIGVTELELVVERGEEAAGRSQRAAEGGALRLRARVPIGEIAPGPGERVRVWFEARDGRVQSDGAPAPQTARSRVLVLERPAERGPAAEAASDGEGGREPGVASSEPGEASSGPGEAGSESGEGADGSDTGPSDALRRSSGAADGTSEPGEAPSESGEAVSESGEAVSESGEAVSESREEASESGERGDEPRERGPGADASESGVDSSEAGAGGADRVGGTAESAAGASGSEERGEGEGSRREGAGAASGAGSERDGQAGGAGGSDGEFERELEEFVERHGADAAEAARRLRERQPPDDRPEDGGGVRRDAAGAAAAGERAADEAGAATGEGAAAGAEAGEQVADGAGAPLESTGRAEVLDLLEMLARGVELSEEWLLDAGWSQPRAAAFIGALERLRAVAAGGGVSEHARRLRFDTRVGVDAVEPGTGVSPGVQRSAGRVEAERDGLERIAPPPEQEVPESLRPVLEAYYRALARHRAGRGGQGRGHGRGRARGA